MKKCAILFGIDDYPQCKLKNAANDAMALSEKLEELGFETKCLINVDAATMARELALFKNILQSANVGLFFFAGHGIQCKGENFLATIDTSFIDESSCKYSSIPLNEVIDVFEDSKVGTKILILDACRDNPFVAWRSVANEGLAPVYAPKGTIIAFSTSPGQKASDGNNGHGIYTNALLMHIGTKKLSIEDMFKRVRNTVSSHTNNKQITWEHTSLMGTFYFNSGFDDGDLKTSYSDSAVADKNYVFEDDNDVQSIVEALKSYNWYSQNPAIRKIHSLNFDSIENDELFILGRNIYQAACGSSGNAMEWIDTIENQLDHIPLNSAVHILNGVLFEIYFNSDGNLRYFLKADCFEKPVRLCQKEKYSDSAAFIRNYLEQYPQRIIYIPGSPEIMSIDVTIGFDDKQGQFYLDGIFLDGLACMYEEGSEKLYEYHYSYALGKITSTQLEYTISTMIGAPQNRIRFTMNKALKAQEELLIPDKFVLLRYIQ